MKKLLVSYVLCAMLVMGVALSAAPDISGKWKTVIETPMGQLDYTYDFVVKETTLTGKIKSNMGASDVIDGKIDGDKVSFVEIFKIEDMDVRITYSGQITSADEIKFTRQVGNFATEQFVAKRVK